MSNYLVRTVPVSSLERVFPDFNPEGKAITSLSCMQNEPISFQVGYFADLHELNIAFNPVIETDLPVSLYKVGFVPLTQADETTPGSRGAGLYPDMLIEKKVNPKIGDDSFPWQTFHFEEGERVQLRASYDSWQSIWININEDGKTVKPGEYEVKVKFLSKKTLEAVGECAVKINVVAAKLPKQSLIYTNWFHCDCLCDYYGVEPFSDRFFEIFQNFAHTAAKNGMNMIMLPAFTPALDTVIGKERMTVQLVDVTVTENGYEFDFSLMKRYTDIARKAGIKYFEHCHFFTQWGAEHAPKIMGKKEGKYVQLFGWNTAATGKKYTEFLRSYIVELKKFLEAEDLLHKTLFHISDEPGEKHLPAYKAARDGIIDLLDGLMTGDALSHYEFYKMGIVKTPIAVTSSADKFVGKCNNLWVYYTGGERKNGLSNRIIVCEPQNNRILGVQLYYAKAKGFLHWGYNYYYSLLSHGLFDPKTDPCGYGNLGGTSYSVYPNFDGTAIQSTRQKVFFEGLNDLRALKLHEKYYGRTATMEFVEGYFGKINFRVRPESAKQYLEFRNELNKRIEKAL